MAEVSRKVKTRLEDNQYSEAYQEVYSIFTQNAYLKNWVWKTVSRRTSKGHIFKVIEKNIF